MTPNGPKLEDWVTLVFDHEVTSPEWYWDDDDEAWNLPAQTLIQYLTRLFQEPLPILHRYSDAQLNQGFWFLVGSGSDRMHALFDARVPIANRVDCVKAIGTLFEKLFAVRCSPHLSHLDEPKANPLNGICYMWWDIFPTWGRPGDPQQKDLDHEILSLLARKLEIPAAACQESALHGLGHWHISYSTEVRRIVSDFLGKSPPTRPELRRYAEAAKAGSVQ